MRGWWLALLLPLAACGDESAVGENRGVTARQIERVSTPRETKADPQASVRLEPVTLADLDREGLLGAGCDFSRGGTMLLAAVGSGAIARVGGELRHLVQSAPAGPSGGFFEERQLSLSVGRTGEAGPAVDEATGWPARLTVTNRRTEVQQELDGIWTCGS